MPFVLTDLSAVQNDKVFNKMPPLSLGYSQATYCFGFSMRKIVCHFERGVHVPYNKALYVNKAVKELNYG